MLQILIPTDFSENSWNAIKYGMALYQNSKCTFHLVHIHPIPPYSGAGSSVRAKAQIYEEHVLKDSKEQLQQLLQRIKELPFNTDHIFITSAKHDFFVESIKRESEERKIDMIIMGTKGASGLKKVAMGSNTGDVITKVKCPLLAVPEEAKFTEPKEIVFPTDYHISYDVKVLDTLMAMAKMNKSAIRVLHISRKGEELSPEQIKNKDFLDDYLVDFEHSFHSLTGTKLEAAVQCFTESREVDMIAMVAKSLNFFQRILFRPTVEEISYHTKIPFLVLHE
ncbi:universal stress protein [Flavobacteriaceae bacterium TP-CH-4]|uniref:Universal stress protein n=1 Tax=Pelagihabitans pacificus TaxID=2696054 RepID=A0A967AW61_9FLAO|nr:universal stress protein [Pelagihabitans pacificus]NHF57731.1 universal stress protein [Pelagihabitans pacificus]